MIEDQIATLYTKTLTLFTTLFSYETTLVAQKVINKRYL